MDSPVCVDVSLRCFPPPPLHYSAHSCLRLTTKCPSPTQVSDNMNERLFGVCGPVCVCVYRCSVIPVLRISSHTSLSLNLSSKSSLSFSMVFSFSFRLDTSDISSSFWFSSEDLHRSSCNEKQRLLQTYFVGFVWSV